MKSVILAALIASTATAPTPTTDAERARWTMADMRSLATAIEAYAIDHKVYPEGASLDAIVAAIQPAYIRTAPTRDAWGHAFVYRRGDGGESYTLVSVGSDGVAQPETWATTSERAAFDEDAVFASGQLIRAWPLN